MTIYTLSLAEIEATLYQKIIAEPSSLVISGGSSFSALYARLGEEKIGLPRTQLFFADERCVPTDAPESTYGLVEKLWLSHLPLSQWPVVHRIKGELPPIEAATSYAREVIPFDLVLLGVGSDGHTASLFPGSIAGLQGLVAVTEAELAPFVPRVTLTPEALRNAQEIYIVIAGKGKEEVAAAVRSGNIEQYPIAEIKPKGSLVFLLDRALG
jgi:6-phosphogluconolactonase